MSAREKVIDTLNPRFPISQKSNSNNGSGRRLRCLGVKSHKSFGSNCLRGIFSSRGGRGYRSWELN